MRQSERQIDPIKHQKILEEKAAFRKRHRKRLAEKQAAYAKANPIKARWSTFKSNYNITKEEYDALLIEQDGVCAICEKPEPVPGRSLAIDHNHLTDQVRGLLCSHCNKAIGFMRENPTALRMAAEYLEKWGVIVLPPEEK